MLHCLNAQAIPLAVGECVPTCECHVWDPVHSTSYPSSVVNTDLCHCKNVKTCFTRLRAENNMVIAASLETLWHKLSYGILAFIKQVSSLSVHMALTSLGLKTASFSKVYIRSLRFYTKRRGNCKSGNFFFQMTKEFRFGQSPKQSFGLFDINQVNWNDQRSESFLVPLF